MPTIDMVATGKNIKNVIKENGMSVRDVANAFGFASPYPVYKWQNGQSMPTLDNLVALSFLTGTKMDDLIVTA